MQIGLDPAGAGLQAADGCMWLDRRYGDVLRQAGLATLDDVMATRLGRCLRVLPDRENWHLSSECFPGLPVGMYLKKHCVRTWSTLARAKLGMAAPASAGRIEAQNVRRLAELGIDTMRLAAYGQRLCADGRLESFLLTEELQGYCELREFVLRRFRPSAERGARRDHDFHRLVRQLAGIARQLHRAGYNHRDFNAYHFLIREGSPGQFDLRLIDLQRMQRRRWLRRRWIVKDLAQLAGTMPDGQVRGRDKLAFLRHYLGVRRLRPEDKRLVRDVLQKQRLIQRRERRKAL